MTDYDARHRHPIEGGLKKKKNVRCGTSCRKIKRGKKKSFDAYLKKKKNSGNIKVEDAVSLPNIFDSISLLAGRSIIYFL